jgi:hypothetical protein
MSVFGSSVHVNCAVWKTLRVRGCAVGLRERLVHGIEKSRASRLFARFIGHSRDRARCAQSQMLVEAGPLQQLTCRTGLCVDCGQRTADLCGIDATGESGAGRAKRARLVSGERKSCGARPRRILSRLLSTRALRLRGVTGFVGGRVRTRPSTARLPDPTSR